MTPPAMAPSTVPAPIGAPVSWRVTRRSSYPRRCSLQHSSRFTGMRSILGRTNVTAAESVNVSANAPIDVKAAAIAASNRVFCIKHLLGCVKWFDRRGDARFQVLPTLNARAAPRLTVAGRPVERDFQLLPQDRPDLPRALLAECVRRRLLHVEALGHFEVHRVHSVRGAPIGARDMAALEASVQHRGVARV